VNFWAHVYEGRVPTVARDAPFTSKDIDFCGDQRSVRICAERLNGRARVATFDDATPADKFLAAVAADFLPTLHRYLPASALDMLKRLLKPT
jgi:hypothetical protein